MTRPGRGLLALLTGLLMACSSTKPPTTTRLADGNLLPCPSSPNCVSSQATDEAHRVAPLAFGGKPAEVLPRLRQVIEAMPRTKVTEMTATTLHAEFTSLIFRFVDDVDLLLDAKAKVVQIRSASRVGYSDLGANRKRVEAIRQAFEP